MTDTVNRRTHKISFRLSVDAYNKILETINNPHNIRNQYSTVGAYCKAVCERHPFRHSTRKFRRATAKI